MEILVMKVLHGATQLEGISYESKNNNPYKILCTLVLNQEFGRRDFH
jgi:hypothetical protein